MIPNKEIEIRSYEAGATKTVLLIHWPTGIYTNRTFKVPEQKESVVIRELKKELNEKFKKHIEIESKRH